MKNNVLSRRYADAFFSYAGQTCGQEKAVEDFRKASVLLAENRELILDSLEVPSVTLFEKEAFIDRFFAEGFSDQFRQFLKLLLKKDRINQLQDILEYARVAYSYGQRTRVLLKTSFPLELDLIQQILERLERKFQRKFKLFIELDGNLLGGVKVIMGNTVIDGSVRKRLEGLREKLGAKPLLKNDRTNQLRDILEQSRAAYSYGQRTRVLLSTSFPLEPGLVQQILERLERKFQRKLNLHSTLDRNLLGGVKVIMGNTVIDGSVRKRLEGLKEKLDAIRTS